MMRSETVSLFLAEDIGEVVVIFRKSGKVNFLVIFIIVDGGGTGGGTGRRGERHLIGMSAVFCTSTNKGVSTNDGNVRFA